MDTHVLSPHANCPSGHNLLFIFDAKSRLISAYTQHYLIQINKFLGAAWTFNREIDFRLGQFFLDLTFFLILSLQHMLNNEKKAKLNFKKIWKKKESCEKSWWSILLISKATNLRWTIRSYCHKRFHLHDSNSRQFRRICEICQCMIRPYIEIDRQDDMRRLSAYDVFNERFDCAHI